jgi:chaperonin cofactor prefoldin
MIKMDQRVRRIRKTAQRTMEVAQMTLETYQAIKAMQTAAEADQRIRDRMTVRTLNLERAVATLAKRVETLEVTVAKVQKQQEMDLNSRVEDLRAIYKKIEALETAPTKTVT